MLINTFDVRQTLQTEAQQPDSNLVSLHRGEQGHIRAHLILRVKRVSI